MALSEHIRVGDIGTVFEVSLVDDSTDPPTAVDLTGNSLLEIIFVKPSKVKILRNASIVGAETEGVIGYTTVSGDIDEAGTWRIQAHFILPSGEWRSEIGEFEVLLNL